MVQYVLGALTQ